MGKTFIQVAADFLLYCDEEYLAESGYMNGRKIGSQLLLENSSWQFCTANNECGTKENF